MQWKRCGWGLALLVPMALSFAASGCATIVSGSTQHVHLTSHPHRAFVEIRGEEDDEIVWSGYAPATVKLPRKQGYVVEAKLKGHEPVQTRIDTSLNGWFVGNVLLGIGGIVGGIVDYSTGAMWTLEPEYVALQLVPSVFEDDDEEYEGEGREYMVLLLRAQDEKGEDRQLALPLVRRSSVAN